MRTLQNKAVERLRRWLEQHEDEMAALLADFIAIPTENPAGRDYRQFVEALEKRTLKLGSEFRLGVVGNANRGAISLRVAVFGKSAHVGLQHQGENAFERCTTLSRGSKSESAKWSNGQQV